MCSHGLLQPRFFGPRFVVSARFRGLAAGDEDLWRTNHVVHEDKKMPHPPHTPHRTHRTHALALPDRKVRTDHMGRLDVWLPHPPHPKRLLFGHPKRATKPHGGVPPQERRLPKTSVSAWESSIPAACGGLDEMPYSRFSRPTVKSLGDSIKAKPQGFLIPGSGVPLPGEQPISTVWPV